MKEFEIYHTFRYSASVSLIVILIIFQTKQSINKSSFSQVAAQSLNTRSSSKTNELSSSKFRESFSQIRRKHKPIIQQQTTRINQINEQQVIEQPVQQGQFFEQQQQQVISNRPQQAQTVEESYDSQQQSIDSTNSEPVYGSVKGAPGVDFPNYSMIPNTKFSCDGVPFEPGMYADESTGCQVYHLCYQGRRESFLCGIGTVFNQAIMNCDFWHSVDCSKSSLYYGLNADFGKSLSEPAGGGNLQSSFQTSFSQFEQSQTPIRQIQQQQQQFIRNQQSSIVVPNRPSFTRSEQTVQTVRQLSGGKVSPPKQQQSSNFISQVSGETNSIPSPTIRGSGRFELQRNNAGSNLVSPGRKAAQLSGVIQQQFASAESSPMRSFAAGSESTKTRKVGSSLVVNNLKDIRMQSENNVDVASDANGSRLDSGTKLASKFSKSSSAQITKNQNPSESGDPIWKPFFRSKTKSTTLAGGQMRDPSVPSAPVNHATSSTPAGPLVTQNDSTESNGNGDSTQADGPLPTIAQPDQEPTFSSEENSSPAISNEMPSIPKSSVPPPTTLSSNTEDSSTGTSVTSNVESDVGEALTTTTPATKVVSSEPSTTTAPTTSNTTTETLPASEASAELTTTTPAPSTSLETSPPSNDKSYIGTTTDAEMPTTTATEAPKVTTTTVASATTQSQSEPERSGIQATENDGGSSPAEVDEEKKKKRGVSEAGVEYAAKEGGKKPANSQMKVNSSSVEYVAKDKP